jgi:hypothetical protein
LLQLYK